MLSLPLEKGESFVKWIAIVGLLVTVTAQAAGPKNIGIATGLCADPTSLSSKMNASETVQRFDRIWVPFQYDTGSTNTSMNVPMEGKFHAAERQITEKFGTFAWQCFRYFFFTCETYGFLKLGFDAGKDLAVGSAKASGPFNTWYMATQAAQKFSDWIWAHLYTQDIGFMIRDLQCYPGPPSEFDDYPDPNYNLPVLEPTARKWTPELPRFSPPNLVPVPVGPEPLAWELKALLRDLEHSDVIDYDTAGKIVFVGGSAALVYSLYQQGALASVSLQSAGSTLGLAGGAALCLGVTIGSAFISLGATGPYDYVAKAPWIFADLPQEQRGRIYRSYPKIYAEIERFYQDVYRLSEAHRAQPEIQSTICLDGGETFTIKHR